MECHDICWFFVTVLHNFPLQSESDAMVVSSVNLNQVAGDSGFGQDLRQNTPGILSLPGVPVRCSIVNLTNNIL